MSLTQTSIYEHDVSNPLDTLEELLNGLGWVFSRPNTEELTMHVKSDNGQYVMGFIWQETLMSLQFVCEFDLDIPKERLEMARQNLPRINEDLWLGHFDIPMESARPRFRHTSLLKGWTETSGADHIHNLIEIALNTCEKHFNFFNVMATTLYLPEDLMDLALVETHGEA